MYRIVVNQARNRYRWNKRRGAGRNVSIHSGMDGDDNPAHFDVADKSDILPDNQLIYSEWETEIAREMENLPESHREALILRNVQNFSYDQISEILDCKVGTVKSRLARAREELRKRLGL